MANIFGSPMKYRLEVTTKEFTLIQKCLANAAGLKVSFRTEEKAEAGDLNKLLLNLHLEAIEDERKLVLQRLQKVDEHGEQTNEVANRR